MATVDFTLRFTVLAQKREFYASVLCSSQDWATINLLADKLRQFVNLHEARTSAATLAQV